MSFKYINPGIPSNFALYAADVSNSEEYSRTGYAFAYPYSNTWENPLIWLEVDQEYTEIYASYDIRVSRITAGTILSRYSTAFIADGSSNREWCLEIAVLRANSTGTNKYGTPYLYYNDTLLSMQSEETTAFNTHVVNTNICNVWIHLKKTNSTTLYVNIFLDGEEVVNRDIEVDSDFSMSRFRFFSAKQQYLSHFIISDSYFSPYEKIIEVPVSSTYSNMSENDGVYTALSTGDYLVQTIDKNSLLSDYAGVTPVTGIAVVGYPCYSDGDIVSISGIEYNGSSFIDPIAKVGEIETDTDSSAAALNSWSLETTIASIDSKQYGWSVVS